MLTGADRVLLDQCALLALRARQMRDDILDGEKAVADDDLVRATNAAIRLMSLLHDRKGRNAKSDEDAEAAAVLRRYVGKAPKGLTDDE